jgi:hypothetical protein
MRPGDIGKLEVVEVVLDVLFGNLSVDSSDSIAASTVVGPRHSQATTKQVEVERLL